MNIHNNTVLFTGSSGVLYTDENGVMYRVNAEKYVTEHYDMVMFSKEITTVDGNYVNDTERERIISNILSLTQGVKWLIR